HRPLGARQALAVTGKTKDPDAILSRGNRHLFVVPWRDHTLVGVWHVVHRGDPDTAVVSATEVQAFIDEINEAYPGLKLQFDDVFHPRVRGKDRALRRPPSAGDARALPDVERWYPAGAGPQSRLRLHRRHWIPGREPRLE